MNDIYYGFYRGEYVTAKPKIVSYEISGEADFDLVPFADKEILDQSHETIQSEIIGVAGLFQDAKNNLLVVQQDAGVKRYNDHQGELGKLVGFYWQYLDEFDC